MIMRPHLSCWESFPHILIHPQTTNDRFRHCQGRFTREEWRSEPGRKWASERESEAKSSAHTLIQWNNKAKHWLRDLTYYYECVNTVLVQVLNLWLDKLGFDMLPQSNQWETLFYIKSRTQTTSSKIHVRSKEQENTSTLCINLKQLISSYLSVDGHIHSCPNFSSQVDTMDWISWTQWSGTTHTPATGPASHPWPPRGQVGETTGSWNITAHCVCACWSETCALSAGAGVALLNDHIYVVGGLRWRFTPRLRGGLQHQDRPIGRL